MGKKRGMTVALTMVFCLCMVACLPSKEERQQAAAWRKAAETIAVNYIEEKYGFTPEVLESKSMKQDNVVPVVKYEPETVVIMSYNGQEFYVLANGEDLSAQDAMDNYQEDEITSTFLNYVNQMMQVPVYDVELESGYEVSIPGSAYNLQYNFYKDYFDGTDLETFLTRRAFRAHVKVVGETDLDSVSYLLENYLLSYPKAEILFTSHGTKQDADACEMGSYFDKTVYQNAMNVLAAVSINKGNMETYDFSISQCGDIYYMFPDVEAWASELEEMTADFPASKWNYSNRTYVEADNSAYVLFRDKTEDISDIYVYYPVENLPGDAEEMEDYKMGVSYLKKNSDAYRFERYAAELVGNYLVFEIDIKNPDDFSMRLLVEKEND